MAASKRSAKIGVIAEEDNDVDVLYQLTCKLIRESSFAFKKFVGHGCGKLKRKCRSWAENLIERGCEYIAVLHDLDTNDAAKLRTDLERELRGLNAKVWVVVIPVEELEAWLLSDPLAIQVTFNMRHEPRISKHPEQIPSPKEFLERLVSRYAKATYVNTIHNKKIAKNVRLTALKDRCPSFASYPAFIKKITTQ